MKKLIFFHGNSQSARIWDHIISSKTLSAYRCIAINLPGHGGNLPKDWNDEDYTIPKIGQWLENYLFQQQPDEYILVGFSYASNIIGEALSLPGCKGIVLIGSSAIGRDAGLEQVLLPNPYGEALMAAEPDPSILNGFIRIQLLIQNEAVFALMKEAYLHTHPAVRTNIPKVLMNQGLADEIAAILAFQLPVLAIAGVEEKNVVPDYLDRTRLVKRLWNGKTHLVENAAHAVHVDQPKIFLELLSEFASAVFK